MQTSTKINLFHKVTAILTGAVFFALLFINAGLVNASNTEVSKESNLRPDAGKVEALENTTTPIILNEPVIFGGMSLISVSGEPYRTASPIVVAGSSFKIAASFSRGVTEVSAILGNKPFTLSLGTNKKIWSGTVQIPKKASGSILLRLHAINGGDNSFDQIVSAVTIVDPLIIKDSKTGRIISGAVVTIEKKDPSMLAWSVDQTTNQLNPQTSGKDGSIILDSLTGMFRLRVEAPGYWSGVTRQFSLTEPTSLTNSISLSKRSWYHFLLPLRTWPFPLKAEDVLVASKSILDVSTRESVTFRVEDLSGTKRTLNDFYGKTVLISAVATWNNASQEQLAILHRLQAKVDKDIEIYPLIVQQPAEVLSSVLERGNYQLNGLVDETGLTTKSLNITLLPAHFFFDKKGVLRRSRSGLASAEELLNALEEIK